MSDSNYGSDRGSSRRNNSNNNRRDHRSGRGIGSHLYRRDHNANAYSVLSDAPTTPSQPSPNPDARIAPNPFRTTGFPPLAPETAARACRLKDAEIARLAASLAAATARAAALQDELDAFARWLRQAPGSASASPVGSSEGSEAPEALRQRASDPQGRLFGIDGRGGGMTQDARFDGGGHGASGDNRGGFGDRERGWRGGRAGGSGPRGGRGGRLDGGRRPREGRGGYHGGNWDAGAGRGASAGGGRDDVGAGAAGAVGGWDQPDDAGSGVAKVGDW